MKNLVSSIQFREEESFVINLRKKQRKELMKKRNKPEQGIRLKAKEKEINPD